MVKNPNWQEADYTVVGYFTSVAKELNSGLPRTNPATNPGRIDGGLEPRTSRIQDQ